jgi:hypothetical protein
MSHRKQRALVSIGPALMSLGLFLLYAVNCGETIEGIIALPGKCPSPTDDGDPCTDDVCSDGTTVRHPVLQDGDECRIGQNGGQCRQGVCKLTCLSTQPGCGCEEAADCPSSTECMEWGCDVDKLCKSTLKTGMLIAEQVNGDCQKVVCTADGTTAIENDDADAPVDANGCMTAMCVDGSPVGPVK